MKRILKTPLLPQNKATVAVSENATNAINGLKKIGIEVFEVKNNPKMSRPVADHPDCNLLQLDKSTFVCDQDLLPFFIDFLKSQKLVNYLTIGQGNTENKEVKVYSEKITSPYPGEALINVKRLADCIVCNTKYVAKTVQVYSAAKDINLYHCNQGYVGCSSVLVSDNAAMTDDESVYETLHRIGIDCLMLSKGQIKLSGYNYGFVGGCCGFIDKNLLAFNGKLNSHSDEYKIKEFLRKYNVEYIELNDEPLTDIGGIVPILEDTD